MAQILKIKKSHKGKDEWIVYNPDNFKLHTHCHNLRVAIIIKNNVERLRLPRSRNIQTLYSHLRLTNNKRYREQILCLIAENRQKTPIISTELLTDCGQKEPRGGAENEQIR